MSALLVRDCGGSTSLQDFGRFHWQRHGVSPSGAMDRYSLALANALVSNVAGGAAIEFAVFGGSFVVEGGPVRVALAGAVATLKVDGMSVPPLTSVTAHDGQVITVDPARTGVFAYLAIEGGPDVAPMLGSRSLHLRSALGGLNGRLLRPGDKLPLNRVAEPRPERRITRLPATEMQPFRVMLGPQDDLFSQAGIETFLSGTYKVSAEADRMGYRLTGPKIEHKDGYNIVSDGIVTGAIQVPGAGEPIVLLADRQTTGGYPKIAAIISADLARFTQSRPGAEVRFAAVDRAAALAGLRAREAELSALIESIRPADEGGLGSERLLSLNLVDGWLDAKG